MILQDCCPAPASGSGSGTASSRESTGRSLNGAVTTRKWSVWIGVHAFVIPGANTGEAVVVSAGSVVRGKDIEPYAIVAGDPARKVGSRRDRVAGDLPAGTPPGAGMPGS